MPGKNIVKVYDAGGYYHIYNRGVEKRLIFEDDEDYKKFIGFLKVYLTPIDLQGLTLKDDFGRTIPPSRKLNNYSREIELHAYCLMPNHFHLLYIRVIVRSMPRFMQSLMTKYSIYFNKKYSRIGSLFQGAYKTVRIESEQQFTYVSKYIHRNPLPELPTRSHLEGLVGYKYSSYGNYLNLFIQNWVKTDDILHYFSKSGFNSYKSFVEESGDISLVYSHMIDLDY